MVVRFLFFRFVSVYNFAKFYHCIISLRPSNELRAIKDDDVEDDDGKQTNKQGEKKFQPTAG